MSAGETTREASDRLHTKWRQANYVTDSECARIGHLLCDHEPRDLALTVIRLLDQPYALDLMEKAYWQHRTAIYK